MRKGFFILILPLVTAVILPISHAPAAGPLDNELARVKGFNDYQKFNKRHDDEREAGAGAVKQSREQWEEKLAAAIPLQKAAEEKKAKTLTENSPEYFEDLKVKENEARKQREQAEQYSAEKKRQEAGYVNLLSEAREYGLYPEPERIDWRKRTMYAGDGRRAGSSPIGGGRSGRGGGSATSGFVRPPDFGGGGPEGSEGFVPPPPPTQSGFEGGGGPDFFEPDIPPPPPPEGGFDEDIPPPIFDDPDF